MRTNWRLLLIGFSLLASSHVQAGVSQNGAVSISGATGFQAALADPSAGFGYFVTTGTAATIEKIKLSDVTSVGSIALSTPIAAAAIDTVHGKAYFAGSSLTELWIYKVDLAGFTVQASTHRVHGTSSMITGVVLDTAGANGYFVFDSSPTSLAKTNLSDLGATGFFTLNNFSNAQFVIRDVTTANAYAYLISSTTPAMIGKVNLSSATPSFVSTSSSGTLGLGEGPVHSVAMDHLTKTLYLGLGKTPARIIEVNGNTLAETASVAIGGGANDLTTGVFDPTSNFAYFASRTAPAQIVGLNAANNQNSTFLTLSAGENNPMVSFEDGNGYMFVGLNTSPALIVRLDLQGGLPTITRQPEDATVRPGQTAFFRLTASGRVTSYQWYKDGIVIASGTANVVGIANVSLADNNSNIHCIVTNAQGTTQSRDAVLTIQPEVRVYPNPWRADRHTGVDMTFDHLAPGSKIKIFTLSSHWVRTLTPTGALATWDLTNDAGERVASGYYLYAVTTGTDEQTVAGKLAVIR